MLTAAESLARLKAGNQRFIANQHGSHSDLQTQRRATISSQKPFAIVLGCSDSRVPVEYVFDQGLGDLFVIRVAGNIADSSQLGSIEFAVKSLGVPLIVVLGHSHCGAVTAAMAAVEQKERVFGNLGKIIENIKPSVQKAIAENPDLSPEKRLDAAIMANVNHSIAQVKAKSALLSERIENQTLTITGAFYCLESAKVSFGS